MTLYDAWGQPVRTDSLKREIAAPTLVGVRTPWHNPVGGGLTPERLARILRAAGEGDAHEYLTLAEEMEEREPHYGSVLGTRKRAVSGLPLMVEAAADEGLDAEIADAVRELTRRPEFGELVDDLLDGLGKGFSVCEILWDTSGKQWWPRDYEWRDPRFFVFDRESGRQVRLLDEADTVYGIPLPPFKFVVHFPRLKTGFPLRGGLARLAAVTYMCKSYDLTDWLAFAEVYGMPLRIGRYGPAATAEDLKVLRTAVANLGMDAAAILPDSMRIEFQDAMKGNASGDLFQTLAEWLDKQTSKAVLGQTASTEGTPGKLGNEASQEEVRQDIKRADAKALSNTINRHLVKPFVDLNWGPQDRYPAFQLFVKDPEDIGALADALAKLVPLGLRVEASVVRDKLGLPDPPKKGDAEILGAPAAAANRHAAPAKARNQAGGPEGTPSPDQDELDALLEPPDDWEPILAPVMDPIQALADACATEAEFLAKLPGLLDTMDTAGLVRSLALKAFKARALGDPGPNP